MEVLLKVYRNIDEGLQSRYNDEKKYFMNEFKHKSVAVSSDGKTIRNIDGGGETWPHCYLNVQMVDGVHHFVFVIEHRTSSVYFGCSREFRFDGCRLYKYLTSCSIGLWDNCSRLYGSNGTRMKNDGFTEVFAEVGVEYEVIFDMNDKSMSIMQGDGEEVFLWGNIKNVVYPFVSIVSAYDSVSLVEYWRE